MTKAWGYIITAFIFFLLIWIWTLQINNVLGYSAFISGGALLVTIAFLSLFNVRKRLSFLLSAPVHQWFLLHAVGGFLALFLFWLHTGVFWPQGLYTQILAVLFYGATLSGILGLIMEKIYPNFLTRIGLECIYERIPQEIADLRNKAECLILECTKETDSDTLAQHYLETLRWFFQRPRFFINHIFGGQNAQHWVRQQCYISERFLNEKERGYLDQLFILADTKRKIDCHYFVQTLLKGWLLVHVPLAVAVLAMVFWHLIVIQVFFL